jgi:mRNA-degrading endonuclease toxin of MazEF toxin-antitoxin module
MTNGITLEPRDIILAIVNFDDQPVTKKRPALVVSRPIFHQNSEYAVVVGITSNPASDPFLEPIKNSDLESGALKLQSQVMCQRIVHLRRSTVEKKLAKVTTQFYEKITKRIKNDILEL